MALLARHVECDADACGGVWQGCDDLPHTVGGACGGDDHHIDFAACHRKTELFDIFGACVMQPHHSGPARPTTGFQGINHPADRIVTTNDRHG